MTPAYMREILFRLNRATQHVAKTKKYIYYPELKKDVNRMSEKEIMDAINLSINFLTVPEYSYIMFRK